MTAAMDYRSEHQADRAGYRAWLMLLPLLLWLLLFVVAPNIVLLVWSFYRGTGPGEVEATLTLENYRRAFASIYLEIFARSIGYAALITALCAVIGYPVAYQIGRASQRWRNRLLLLLMIPFLTSFLIRAYAWAVILHDRGVLNGLLEALRITPGLLPHGLRLLDMPTAVVIGLVYTYLPFMILPIYGSVEKLDPALIEAASDLGAGPGRAFWRVIFPLTWPGVTAGIALVFIPSIAMFAVTRLLGGGRVPLIGDVIEDQFGSSGNPPFGAALGVLLLGLFLLSFLLYPRRRGAG